MSRVVKMLRTALSLDPRWVLRQLRNPESRAFYWSKLRGRSYYDADIFGTPLRFGFSMYHHHRVARALSEGMLFEPTIISAWKDHALNASLIYDIGGFNGLFGMLAAKVNPRARVVIFEPDPFNAHNIRENIRMNHCGNTCRVEEAAVTDHAGDVFFAAMGKTGSHIDDASGTKVKAITLDSLPAADLIKIDVEGAEGRVIAGSKNALRAKPVIFLELHGNVSEEERDRMWHTLEACGYRGERIDGSNEGNPHFLFK